MILGGSHLAHGLHLENTSLQIKHQDKGNKLREQYKTKQYQVAHLFILFYWRFLLIFRERGREGEKEGEKHQCVVASRTSPTGDLDRNPGTCPDWESHWQRLGPQAGTQSTEPTSQSRLHIYNLRLWEPVTSYLQALCSLLILDPEGEIQKQKSMLTVSLNYWIWNKNFFVWVSASPTLFCWSPPSIPHLPWWNRKSTSWEWTGICIVPQKYSSFLPEVTF